MLDAVKVSRPLFEKTALSLCLSKFTTDNLSMPVYSENIVREANEIVSFLALSVNKLSFWETRVYSAKLFCYARGLPVEQLHRLTLIEDGSTIESRQMTKLFIEKRLLGRCRHKLTYASIKRYYYDYLSAVRAQPNLSQEQICDFFGNCRSNIELKKLLAGEEQSQDLNGNYQTSKNTTKKPPKLKEDNSSSKQQTIRNNVPENVTVLTESQLSSSNRKPSDGLDDVIGVLSLKRKQVSSEMSSNKKANKSSTGSACGVKLEASSGEMHSTIKNNQNPVEEKPGVAEGATRRNPFQEYISNDNISLELALVIEQMSEEYETFDSQAGDLLEEGSQSYCQKVHILEMSVVQYYQTFDLHRNPHYHKRKKELPAFLNSLIAQGVSFEYYSSKQSHNNNFLTVLNYGTPEFQTTFPDIEVDPRRLLISATKRSMITKRNNKTFDYGFLNHAYASNTEEDDFVLPRPCLKSLETVAGDDNSLWQDVGKMTEAMHNILKSTRDSTKLFQDKDRNLMYGSEFGASLGLVADQDFGFEAGTLAVSDSSNYLRRHRDRLNCNQPSYNIFCSISRIMFKEKENKDDPDWSRIGCFAFTRQSCGTSSQKEFGYARYASECVTKFRSVETPYSSIRRLSNIAWQMLDWDKRVKIDECSSNKLGYMSPAIHGIRSLLNRYKLDKSSVTQLVYCTALVNGMEKMYRVFHLWLQEGVPNCENAGIVIGFYLQCKKWYVNEGDSRKNPGKLCMGGRYPRFNPHNLGWPGVDRISGEVTEERITAAMKHICALEHILCHECSVANLASDTDTVLEKLKRIEGIGEMSCQHVLPVAAFSGFPVNKKHLRHGYIKPDAPHAKALNGMGCNTAERRASLLKSLSIRHGISEAEVENILCECHRGNNSRENISKGVFLGRKKELFFQGQSLYNLVKFGSGYKFVERTLEGEWTNCTEISLS